MSDSNVVGSNLGDISTCWADLADLHRYQDSDERANRACAKILDRYQEAIRRYVRAALRDPEATEEVYQNFCFRLVRGDFRNVDPGRGRFRDYLKKALIHLVQDYRRQAHRWPAPLSPSAPEPAIDDAPSDEDDRRFLACWRDQLFHRALLSLEDVERRSDRPIASVLRLRMAHPDWQYAQYADYFSRRMGREMKPEAIRKLMMDARHLLREILVHEVALTLDIPSRAAIEEELIDLGLFETCRDVLKKRAV